MTSLQMTDGIYTPTPEDIAEWTAAYPSVSVEGEIAKMAAWMNANPKNRKTVRGGKRFVNSWLSRADKTGGSPAITEDDLSSLETTFDAVKRDDIIHKLRNVSEFFRKDMTRDDAQIWLRAFGSYSADHVLKALDKVLLTSKYMPRPADVIEHINEIAAQERVVTLPQRKGDDVVPAPPHVRKAWLYVIGQWGGSFADMFKVDLSESEVEEAILLCNQQVRNSGNWEALPPHLWLESVHGRPYPGGAA